MSKAAFSDKILALSDSEPKSFETTEIAIPARIEGKVHFRFKKNFLGFWWKAIKIESNFQTFARCDDKRDKCDVQDSLTSIQCCQLALKMAKWISHKIWMTKCGNSRIFLPLSFYVKSILVIWKPQKLALLSLLAALNFVFLGIFYIFKCEILIKIKIQSFKNCWNGSFSKSTRIDFM